MAPLEYEQARLALNERAEDEGLHALLPVPLHAKFLQRIRKVVPESTSAAVLLFGLVPLSFMEGGSLFRWSKVLWSAMFGVALFLFWHVLLNKNSKYGAAFENTNTQVVLALLGFWTVVTVGTFLLFRRSRPRAPAAQGPFQQPPPGWGQQQPWGPSPHRI